MTSLSLRLILIPLLAGVFTIAPFAAETAFAQATKAPAKPAQSKKTTVNFEDQLVEGTTQKPELFYLLQQRNNNFKRLIKLRENFLPEMRKTSEDLSRKGNSN